MLVVFFTLHCTKIIIKECNTMRMDFFINSPALGKHQQYITYYCKTITRFEMSHWWASVKINIY